MGWAIVLTFLLTFVGTIVFAAYMMEKKEDWTKKENIALKEQIGNMRQQINIAVVRTPMCKCDKNIATHKYEHNGETHYACTSCLPSQLEKL